MSVYRDQLETFLATLDIHATNLLDIGGSAYPIASRVHSFHADNATILDNNNEQGRHDKWAKPDFVADIQDWQAMEHVVPADHFDYVVCLEVFEYIYKPFQALENIYRCMERDGILLISFGLCYPIHEPIESDFLRYTPNGARKLLTETGFSIQQEQLRTTNSPLLESYYRDDKLRSAKNMSHDVTGIIILAKKTEDYNHASP